MRRLVTTFGYDANGNRETVTRPSGRVQKVVYDALDRPSQTIGASDGSAAYAKPARTFVKYDEVGRVKQQSAPTFLDTADAAGVEWTTYDYWPSGDVKTSTDPWGIQTTYGYNKLGQQTTRALGVAASSDPSGDGASREMTWAFWPDGSPKQRTDAGAHPAQVADNSGPFQFGAGGVREDPIVQGAIETVATLGVSGTYSGLRGLLVGGARVGGGQAAANGGNRVFWSGGDVAKFAAADYANANGGKTLEMTIACRALEKIPYNRFTIPVTGRLWNAASKRFAQSARGDAHGFFGPNAPRPGSVFARIEGPILDRQGNTILQHFLEP